MRAATLIALMVILAAPLQSFSALMKLAPEGGRVEILAVGKPAFIKIRGTGAAPVGELVIDGKKVTGKFDFRLTTLDTGIELRNEHMQDKYLNTKEHPKAELKIQDLQLRKDWKLTDPEISDADFKGELTLHGVTRPVRGKFSVNEKREVNAGFKIKLTDFSIEIPKYLGVTVADEVNIDIKIAELKESK